MTELFAIIEAVEGISLGGERGEDAWRTLDYIPGRQLRGALAAAHRLLRPEATEEFDRWFTTLTVSDAYPIDGDWSGDGAAIPFVRVLPRTTMSCKDSPRLGLSSESEGHPIRDDLIPSLLFVLDGQRRPDVFATGGTCQVCKAPLERLSGYLVEHGRRRWRASPKREVRAHVGISRSRGGAFPGILFARQNLVAGTRFLATFQIDDELADALREFLDDAASAGVLRVGSSRSRGLGALRVTGPFHRSPPPAPLAERLDRFNHVLRAEAARLDVTLGPAWYLPITLLSDAIVVDDLFRPCGQLTSTWLREAAGIEGTLALASASLRLTTGWNDLIGLPREVTPAIERGSVFVFELATPPSDESLGRLQRLESDGIGEERAVGFGAIRIADPIHLEFQKEVR
ncbi:MAG: hypothetical protein KatS3mg060_2882 [Dehalococcoidia bacterium]|nr:MAG: hypothetical protein KatS3mg060_2882 [Dehalococcoidia bacterium]